MGSVNCRHVLGDVVRDAKRRGKKKEEGRSVAVLRFASADCGEEGTKKKAL